MDESWRNETGMFHGTQSWMSQFKIIHCSSDLSAKKRDEYTTSKSWESLWPKNAEPLGNQTMMDNECVGWQPLS